MKERRKNMRFPLSLRILVEKAVAGEALCEHATLCDISVGGACFSLQRKVSAGDELWLKLSDDDSRFASALGLETSDSGPLLFTTGCTVVRRWIDKSDSAVNLAAVKFAGPLTIKRLDEINSPNN